MTSLKYSYPQIVLQEVPDEISLAISISGCPLACPGCHSTETWDHDFGEELTIEGLHSLIKKHKHITCVLFYGGEWQPTVLESFLRLVKQKNLKTCLYTGYEYDKVPENLFQYLDYLKTGPYIKSLGGLTSPRTNQKFHILKKTKIKSNNQGDE